MKHQPIDYFQTFQTGLTGIDESVNTNIICKAWFPLWLTKFILQSNVTRERQKENLTHKAAASRSNDFRFSLSTGSGCAEPMKAFHGYMSQLLAHFHGYELQYCFTLYFSLATLLNVWTNTYILPSTLPGNCLWVVSVGQEKKPILLKTVNFNA